MHFTLVISKMMLFYVISQTDSEILLDKSAGPGGGSAHSIHVTGDPDRVQKKTIGVVLVLRFVTGAKVHHGCTFTRLLHISDIELSSGTTPPPGLGLRHTCSGPTPLRIRLFRPKSSRPRS